jgi:hypothetical protein
MKNIVRYSFLFLAALVSCKDDVDVEGLLNFPPSIERMNPPADGAVVIGDFDMNIVFVDGKGSPLKSASVSLKTASGTELFSTTQNLDGTRDSLFVDGTEFNAAALAAGEYRLLVTAQDVNGKAMTLDTSFDIITSLYPANNNEMYIAGEFNGWGWDQMELVSPYTWEIKNINLQGKKWKFKNTKDWTDQDWGDGSGCDGVMNVKGSDTDCGFDGLVNVKFNDQTLEYSIEPAIKFSKNLSNLYLLGDVNNFEGDDYKFNLIADNTWELAEIRLAPTNLFKLSEAPNLRGKIYGDDSPGDGKANEFGASMKLLPTQVDAFYKITFNDKNLKYSINLVRLPYPDKLFLIGSIVNWNLSNAIEFKKVNEGVFEMFYQFAADDEFKFIQAQGSYSGDWGKDPANAGKIVQEGEINLTVPSGAGFYRIQVNFVDKTYTLTKTSWGLVGEATPGGWNTDTDMTFEAPYTWKIDVTLAAGLFKFRANDAWDINLGDTGANGSLEYNGDNITGPGVGNYTIKIVLAPSGYTYTVMPQ